MVHSEPGVELELPTAHVRVQMFWFLIIERKRLKLSAKPDCCRIRLCFSFFILLFAPLTRRVAFCAFHPLSTGRGFMRVLPAHAPRLATLEHFFERIRHGINYNTFVLCGCGRIGAQRSFDALDLGLRGKKAARVSAASQGALAAALPRNLRRKVPT